MESTPSILFFLPLVFVVNVISLVSASDAAPQIEINVWPKPTSVSWSGPAAFAVPLSPSFRVLNPYSEHPYLRAAAARYTRLLLLERYRPLRPPHLNLSSSTPPLSSLVLSVVDASAPLLHGVDESYTLSITANGSSSVAELSAATPWGAMRG
ncbi:hypothetical protein GW17_00043192, partial [Ensete ventricosum]